MCLITVGVSYVRLGWLKCKPGLKENALNKYKVKKRMMKILVIKGVQSQKYHCFESKIRAKELFL